MSLGRWIKSLFGGSRTRDISRLTTSASGQPLEDTDAVEEQVNVSGGPLKENHRRLALRDKRLLPKVKSPARQLRFAKKKKVMSAAEAGRLFGGTMRTRNRNLRDLLADEDQLKRYQLPIWKTDRKSVV